MSTLIYQHEGRKADVLGNHFGFTVDQESDGSFSFRARTRTYDGIKVVGKFDSEPVTMTATTKEEAFDEAKVTYIKWVAAMHTLEAT
jgi:hypothetical protein